VAPYIFFVIEKIAVDVNIVRRQEMNIPDFCSTDDWLHMGAFINSHRVIRVTTQPFTN